MKFPQLGAAILAGLLIAGCASDPEVKATSSDSSAKKVEQVGKAELDGYMDAVASSDVDEMENAKELAVPGSIAEAYLIHQAAVANAALDGGTSSPADKLTKIKAGYKLCSTDGNETVCTTYESFKSNDGKIASFTVNGNELADRIAIGQGKPTKAGDLATVRFISSYKAGSNYLWVSMQIKSGDKKLNLGTFDAKYRAPEGRQSTAQYAEGPSELGADSTATVSIGFEKAEPGGEITLVIWDEDYNSEKSVTIKIG